MGEFAAAVAAACDELTRGRVGDTVAQLRGENAGLRDTLAKMGSGMDAVKDMAIRHRAEEKRDRDELVAEYRSIIDNLRRDLSESRAKQRTHTFVIVDEQENGGETWHFLVPNAELTTARIALLSKETFTTADQSSVDSLVERWTRAGYTAVVGPPADDYLWTEIAEACQCQEDGKCPGAAPECAPTTTGLSGSQCQHKVGAGAGRTKFGRDRQACCSCRTEASGFRNDTVQACTFCGLLARNLPAPPRVTAAGDAAKRPRGKSAAAAGRSRAPKTKPA
jgi:hypothetical protein